jgi:uncharacterized protein (TIGR02145 family)
VITILAILGTIAFLSLQWYSANARDSKRVWDVNNIKKSLELFTLQTERYPLPDNSEEVTYSGEIVWYQWTVWDNVIQQLWRNLKKKPTDPSTEEEYIYSTTENKVEYEVLWIYEWGITNNSITNQTHAADTGYIKVDGTYNQLYVDTNSFVIPVPSLITSETLPVTLDGTNIKSQVVTWQLNRPARTNTTVQTGWLDIVLSVYTGSIKKTSSNQEKIDAMTAIQNAYTWTTLATIWRYQEALSQTNDDALVSFVDTVVLNDDAEPAPVVLTWWRALDPNCHKEDITIGSQTWAWCNSTLWTWFEWGKNDDGSDGDVSFNCHNYHGANNIVCPIGDPQMASSYNPKDWYIGTSTYWDSPVDSIWGKLYTWPNSSTACPSGRHVPSDTEWEVLETTMNGWVNCRNATNFWLCTWLWWRDYTTKTTENNIIQALQIPLAGTRVADSDFFANRWRYAYIWSSTTAWSSQFARYFDYSRRETHRANWDEDGGFSVRCMKD